KIHFKFKMFVQLVALLLCAASALTAASDTSVRLSNQRQIAINIVVSPPADGHSPAWQCSAGHSAHRHVTVSFPSHRRPAEPSSWTANRCAGRLHLRPPAKGLFQRQAGPF